VPSPKPPQKPTGASTRDARKPAVLPSVDQTLSGPTEVEPPPGGHLGAEPFNLYTPHIPPKVSGLFDTQQPSGPCNRITVTDFGEGIVEATVVYQEEPLRPPRKGKRKEPGQQREKQTRSVMSPEDLEKCICRAKKDVRHRCLMLRVDRMLTFTYHRNETDREVCQAEFAKFIRLANRQFGQFAYVAALEQQKRGAWHVHVAVNRFYNVLVLRHLWHKATGDDGAVNVTSPRKGGKWNRQNLARYLSKYMSKDADKGGLYEKRYSSSRGIPKPERTTYYLPAGPNTFRLAVKLIQQLTGKKIERAHNIRAGTTLLTWLSTY